MFSLLAGEMFCRIYRPVRLTDFFYRDRWTNEPVDLQKGRLKLSRTLGFELVRDSKSFGTNSFGMLDFERKAAKPARTYRIICLGDSTTADGGYKRRYTYILEKLLFWNSGGRSFEVWNCAVPAYGLPQYCTAVREKWLKFSPDMVIIGFCLNDLMTTPLIVREGKHLTAYCPNGEVRCHPYPFLLRHSFLYRRIIAASLAVRGDRESSYVSQLRELAGQLRARNIRLLLVILGLPEPLDTYPAQWRLSYEKIRRMASGLGIEVLDTTPAFQRHDPASLARDRRDCIHFNDKGRFLVAWEIFKRLRTRELAGCFTGNN